MIDVSTIKDAPVIEEIVNVLCDKTQNTDRSFYKVEVAYFLAKMASSMRAVIKTKDRGDVVVNLYALALAPSGFGKGHSVAIMEGSFIGGFKKRFLQSTMNEIAENHIDILASDRALRNGTFDTTEKEGLVAEYKRLGAYPFTFDSGTAPAVKQLRDKLLMANCGAINLQIDEIGSNLISATEVLNIFLELFDQGIVKQKLVKNTVDNSRSEDRDGKTPTNLLLFGTPVKLLDGGQTEDQFYSFLEIGYARRCLFGLGKINKKSLYTQSPNEIFQRLTNPSNEGVIQKWSNHFTNLADSSKYNWQLTISDDVSIKLIEYKPECERLADELPDYEEIKKAELLHRYFKALKLAGALAFVDESLEVTETHLYQAIKLVEESGAAFASILTREKPYMKLAKFIAGNGTELTHADITEALPFYKSSASVRNELLALATAWGYKNNILIKRSTADGIEFFRGESLKETNLDKLILSYSTEMAFNYESTFGPWDRLDELFLAPDFNWCNHHFRDEHRANEKVIPGFNLVVLDVDGTCRLKVAQELFKDYKYIMYTTKRHGEEGKDRFRLILPTNYELKLTVEEYKEFMNGLIRWLPFEVDESSNQPSKKWLSNPNGNFFVNDGILLDALKFIPRTPRNSEYLKESSKIENFGNLERWFLQNMAQGNRNNMFFKYGMALVDSGLELLDVQNKVRNFNKQLENPLPEDELDNSVFITLAKKY